MRYPDRDGKPIRESTGTEDREEAYQILRSRLDVRDNGTLPAILAGGKLTFAKWAQWFADNVSALRSWKTHQATLNALKFLAPVLGDLLLPEITAERIEDYLRRRLSSGRRVHTKFGIQYRGKLKPATVHQEFRILRRILNVAVKKQLLVFNPCTSVELPMSLSGAVQKPHYFTFSEQERFGFFAPPYLRHAVDILVETGLRPYKELMPMKKTQVDLENLVLYIPDSKTPAGVATVPITKVACDAFEALMRDNPQTEYLFPALRKSSKPYLGSPKKSWAGTLKRAGIPRFPIYQLRHTFATRLSAGGVADHFVTQALRQGDSAVFKRYSHASLNMVREALGKMDRLANEHGAISGTLRPN
jgi:integrase